MATAAAAIIARARRNVIDHLLTANAIAAESAVPYAPPRRLEQRQLDRLAARGVVHRTAPGKYWIDLPAYVAWRKTTRMRLVAFLIVAAIVFALLLLVIPRG